MSSSGSKRKSYSGKSSHSHSSSSSSKKPRSSSSSSSSSSKSNVASPTGAIGRFASHSKRANSDELKTLDTVFSGAYNAVYTPDTAPAQILNLNNTTNILQAVNLSQQGVGIAQRLGNKIAMKSVRLRFFMEPTGNGQGFVGYSRVMLVYDRNANLSYPATNTILSDSLQANTIGAGTWVSNLNPNFFDRFAVLMDKVICLPPVSAAIGNNLTIGPTEDQDFVIDEFIKLKNLETQYAGTANPMTVGQVQTGSLSLLCIGASPAANTGWALQGSARLRFRDV